MSGMIHDFLTVGFLRNALLVAVLSSVACGMVGSVVVVRRITFLAGGIAHCVLGGMGAARYLQVVYGLEWLHPLYGAAAAAVAAAVVIGLVSLHVREREDTVIGAVWAVGMAVGILFISRTPGYSEDLMSYLFGNIVMVSGRDVVIVAVLDAAVTAAVILFYKQILAVCFDEEYARLRGVAADAFFLMILCVTAVTVVVLVSMVGLILVIALLTLPAAAAGRFGRTLKSMMVLAVLFCAATSTAGLAASYRLNLPAGAVIIVLAGCLYLGILAGERVVRRAFPPAPSAGGGPEENGEGAGCRVFPQEEDAARRKGSM